MVVSDIKEFLDYYTKLRGRTKKLVELAPPSQIEWRYRNEKFSIGDTIRHIASIERNLYAEVVQRKKSKYSGCGKELAEDYDHVVAYFDKCHQESMEIFCGLSNDDLNTKYEMPGGAKISGDSVLRLLAEHEIHHRGQLYVYLGMLGIKTPPIFGLTSEQVINLSDANH